MNYKKSPRILGQNILKSHIKNRKLHFQRRKKKEKQRKELQL